MCLSKAPTPKLPRSILHHHPLRLSVVTCRAKINDRLDTGASYGGEEDQILLARWSGHRFLSIVMHRKCNQRKGLIILTFCPNNRFRCCDSSGHFFARERVCHLLRSRRSINFFTKQWKKYVSWSIDDMCFHDLLLNGQSQLTSYEAARREPLTM